MTLTLTRLVDCIFLFLPFFYLWFCLFSLSLSPFLLAFFCLMSLLLFFIHFFLSPVPYAKYIDYSYFVKISFFQPCCFSHNHHRHQVVFCSGLLADVQGGGGGGGDCYEQTPKELPPCYSRCGDDDGRHQGVKGSQVFHPNHPQHHQQHCI